MSTPSDARRGLLGAAKKFILEPPAAPDPAHFDAPRLTLAALEKIRMSRSRDRIDCVRCLDLAGDEFARGLVNYSAQELIQIKGLDTSRIEKRLGYKAYDEIIHRDDLVLL